MDYRSKLLELSRNDLNIIAKKLKVKNYGHGTKGELVESILSTKTPKQIKKVVSPSLWDRYHNHVYGVTSIIGLIIAIWTLPNSNPDSLRLPAPTPVVSPSVSEPTARPIPTATNPSPTPTPEQTGAVNLSPSPKRQPAQKRESALAHINRARALLSRGPDYYSAARTECDRALQLDRNNQEAIALKNSIIALDKLHKQNQ